MESISFNEIARYNEWPARLLNKKNLIIKQKNNKEIIREFGHEKWKDVSKIIEKINNPTIQKIEEENQFNQKIVSAYKGEFYRVLKNEIDFLQMKLIEDKIFKYINDVDCIVELGAGYGSKILSLASNKKFTNKKFIAGELTTEGQDALKKIASHMGIRIDVGYCDIGEGQFKELKIPKNSLIFTSYSAHYTSKIKKSNYKKLISLKPNIIIHFEPIYEIFSNDKIYDLMCKKYIEINGYNTNLFSIIQHFENEGFLNLNIEKNIIGSNPFLPISVIECKVEK